MRRNKNQAYQELREELEHKLITYTRGRAPTKEQEKCNTMLTSLLDQFDFDCLAKLSASDIDCVSMIIQYAYIAGMLYANSNEYHPVYNHRMESQDDELKDV